MWPYLPLIIVTALIEPYWVMAGSSLQIQEKAGRFAAWSTARIVVAIVSKLVFVVWLVGGAVGFTIANLVTASAFAAAAFWVMRTEVAPGFSPKIIREGLKIGGPTVPNNLLSYGFRLLDRVVLERFVSLEQVGLYYLALRLADVMRLAGDVLINAWRPVFFKEADDDTFKRQDVPRMIRIATVALASVFVMLSVFSREVVVLFAAPTYRSASAFVPFLAGAMFLKGFQSFPYLTIWLRRKTAWVPLLSVLTLLVSIAANVLFARRWGAMGVAAALVVAYGFLTIMMFVVSRRLYDAVYPWRKLVVVGALSLASVSMSVFLPEAPLSILVKLGIVIGYAGALVATGCIQMTELRALVLTDGMPALLRGEDGGFVSALILALLLLVAFEIIWTQTPVLRPYRWHFRGMLALFWATVLLIECRFDIQPCTEPVFRRDSALCERCGDLPGPGSCAGRSSQQLAHFMVSSLRSSFTIHDCSRCCMSCSAIMRPLAVYSTLFFTWQAWSPFSTSAASSSTTARGCWRPGCLRALQHSCCTKRRH